MEQAGLRPDQFTFSTVIAKAPDYPNADAVRTQMEQAGVKHDKHIFSSLIEAASDFDTANGLRAEMIAARLTADAHFYNGRIGLARSFPAAMAVYGDMRRAKPKPNKFIITTLIRLALDLGKTFQLAKDFRILRDLFNRMETQGTRPNQVIFQHMILSAPDKSAAVDLLRQMIRAGFEPDQRFWNMLARRDIYHEDLW